MNYCICKHSYWSHHLSDPDKLSYCNDCVYSIGSFEKQTWHEFKLDNLRYLEECYARTQNLV